MNGHVRDINTTEGMATAQAFATMKAQCEDANLPVKCVASLLRTDKMTPRELVFDVRDCFHKKVLDSQLHHPWRAPDD